MEILPAASAHDQGAVAEAEKLDIGQGVRSVWPRDRRHPAHGGDRRAGDRAGEDGRVAACPAVDGVIAGAAIDDVIAPQAVDHIVAGRAVQGVGARRAVNRTGRDRRAGDVEEAVSEFQSFDVGQGVGAVGAGDGGHAAAGGDRIGGAVAGEDRRVGPVPAVDGVVVAAADQQVVAGAAVERIAARSAVQLIVTRLAVQRGAEIDQRDHRGARDRDVKGVGAAGGRRRGDQRRIGAGLPPRNLNIVGPGGREGVGEAGIGRRAAVVGQVVVLGQLGSARIEQAQHAVEAGVVDVEHHGVARDDGEGVVLHAPVRRRHNGGMRNSGGIRHVGPGGEVEGPVQGNRRPDGVVGRGALLDDVGRAAALARGAREQLVIAAAAVQGVDAPAAAQDVGVGVAGQDVGVDAAAHLLDARQGVGARAAGSLSRGEIYGHAGARLAVVGDVMAGPAVQGVVAPSADEDVIAVAAVQDIVARSAVEDVSAAQTVDHVIAAETADGVGEAGAGDGLVSSVPAHQKAARGRRRDGLVREFQELHIADGDRLAHAGDGADLPVPGDGVVRAGAREDNGVGAEAPVDLVVAAVAGDDVVGGVAANGVGARTADHVLDHHAEGDGDVADQAAHAGEGALTQVDGLGDAVAGEVEGVGSARIPHREDQGAEGVVGVEPRLAGVGVEAVDGVAGAGVHVRAVQALGRGDVVEKRHGRVAGVAGRVTEVGPRLPLGEVAHHRVLAGILEIDRVGAVGDHAIGAGVVGGRVAEADGVTDLVHQHLLAVAEEGRGRVVAQRTVDPDVARVRRGGRASGQVGEGRGSLLTRGVVAEQDGGVVGILAARVGDLDEGDVGHVGPSRERQLGGGDLETVELAEAAGVGGHGRRGGPEGVRHHCRLAGAGGPAEAGAGDLPAGVDDVVRGLAVGAEGAAVVAVVDHTLRAAVRSVGRAVVPSAATADLVAGDAAEIGIGGRRNVDIRERRGRAEAPRERIKHGSGPTDVSLSVHRNAAWRNDKRRPFQLAATRASPSTSG